MLLGMEKMKGETMNHELAHKVLEIVDFSDDGVSVLQIEETLNQAVSFKQMIMAVDALVSARLIWVDANYVVHRVRL
jgi:hypothetical protein